jgi:hypothetical protein
MPGRFETRVLRAVRFLVASLTLVDVAWLILRSVFVGRGAIRIAELVALPVLVVCCGWIWRDAAAQRTSASRARGGVELGVFALQSAALVVGILWCALTALVVASARLAYRPEGPIVDWRRSSEDAFAWFDALFTSYVGVVLFVVVCRLAIAFARRIDARVAPAELRSAR